MMKSYQSPYNHKVSVIPPDPKCADEEQERERIQLALNRELLELSEQLPFIDARIDELKIVIEALTERLNTLPSEKEEKEARKLQLKKMTGINL